MEFIKKLLDYFKANPLFAAIVVGCLVFIAIIVVIICVLAAKAKKAKAALSVEKTVATGAPVQSVQEKKEEPVSKSTETVAEKAENVEPEVKEQENLVPAPSIEEKTTGKVIEIPTETEMKTEVKEEATTAPIALTEKPKAAVKKEVKSTPKAKETPAVATKTVDPTPQPVKKAKSSRYNGKWTICHLITKDENLGENNTEETYFFELLASNGEKLLSSEEYTSYNGVLKGIETHKANILKNNFRIGLSKKGEYIFKLLNGKNSLLCTGENYPTKLRCENAIESTKRFAQTAVLDENVHDIIVQIPLDTDEAEPFDPDYIGKWIISKTTAPDGDEVYYFELFASNGEKLLSSEEYTSYTGALNGISTHKNNIERDNFRITLTKRGDYIYKLLTGNGQLLCLGEHYKTRRRCESAVESVKRFAKSAPILTAANIAPKN